MNQKEKARQKEQRKNDRKGREVAGGPVEDGVDPDIAGIVPGPQPKPEEDENP
jgi:hypothetical protein